MPHPTPPPAPVTPSDQPAPDQSPPYEGHVGYRLDLPSLVLALVGLVCGALAYNLITHHDANPLLLVPATVSATVGLTHLRKRTHIRPTTKDDQ